MKWKDNRAIIILQNQLDIIFTNLKPTCSLTKFGYPWGRHLKGNCFLSLGKSTIMLMFDQAPEEANLTVFALGKGI